jgi:purine-binding chemotaxis protein CheW
MTPLKKQRRKAMEKQLVVFELAEEFYGLDIALVESIIKMQAITRVPHAPSFVEGVTNLRGKVLPVVDLGKRFNVGGGLSDDGQSANKKDNRRIVVVSIDNTEIGMIVDGVSEVLTISDEIIEPTPPMVMTVDSSFITGIAKLDGRLVILLDLTKVLSSEERMML